MKIRMLTMAIVAAFASNGVWAHHPAADIVDPEIYEMIDANVADTPHADLTFDDMGRDTMDAGDSMESRDNYDAAMEMRDEMGQASEARESAGEISADERGPFEQIRNEDGQGPGADEATIDLLENVLTDTD